MHILPLRYSKMLLCCDRTVCICPLYHRLNVPDSIRATPRSACSEYASGRGGLVMCGCSICVVFVSDEWAIFWCPVTSTKVLITGRFPTMWCTIEAHLLCCWGTQLTHTTHSIWHRQWIASKEYHTLPWITKLSVIGLCASDIFS